MDKWQISVTGDIHLGILQQIPLDDKMRSGIPKGEAIGQLSLHFGCACFLEALLKSYACITFPRTINEKGDTCLPPAKRVFDVAGPSDKDLDAYKLPVKSMIVKSYPRVEHQGDQGTRCRIESPVRYGLRPAANLPNGLVPPKQSEVAVVDCRCYGFDLSTLADDVKPRFLIVKFRDRFDDNGKQVRTQQLKDITEAMQSAELQASVVLVNADDLRMNECDISRHISWEQTISDTLVAFSTAKSPLLTFLKEASFVIVSYDLDGILLIKLETGIPVGAVAVFSSLGIEGDFRAAAPGEMLGSDSVIVAAVAGAIAAERPAVLVTEFLAKAAERGLEGARFLHLHGFTELEQSVYQASASDPEGVQIVKTPRSEALPAIEDAEPKRFYPIDLSMEIVRTGSLANLNYASMPATAQKAETLSRVCKAAKADFKLLTRSITVDLKEIIKQPHSDWSFLTLWTSDQKDIDSLSQDILRKGLEKAWRERRVPAPLCKIGKYVAIGRSEQEAARETAVLVRQYLVNPAARRPFNLAVFGRPGSGKSFLVREVVDQVTPESLRTKTLEFNLSNYTTVKELHGAFHRIRDVALAGRIPVVFWDEFDASVESQQFYWLRFFLAPMWDGYFQEGQDSRPIGKAIFVFAGGRFETYGALRRHLQMGRTIGDVSESEFQAQCEKEKLNRTKVELLHASKGDDFERRLDAYIDLPGIELQSEQGNELAGLRRALILRATIKDLVGPKVFQGNELRISEGAAKKILHHVEFLHGAGSMTTYVGISDLRTSNRFDSTVEPSRRLLAKIFRDPTTQIAVDATQRFMEQAIEEESK